MASINFATKFSKLRPNFRYWLQICGQTFFFNFEPWTVNKLLRLHSVCDPLHKIKEKGNTPNALLSYYKLDCRTFWPDNKSFLSGVRAAPNCLLHFLSRGWHCDRWARHCDQFFFSLATNLSDFSLKYLC